MNKALEYHSDFYNIIYNIARENIGDEFVIDSLLLNSVYNEFVFMVEANYESIFANIDLRMFFDRNINTILDDIRQDMVV